MKHLWRVRELHEGLITHLSLRSGALLDKEDTLKCWVSKIMGKDHCKNSQLPKTSWIQGMKTELVIERVFQCAVFVCEECLFLQRLPMISERIATT